MRAIRVHYDDGHSQECSVNGTNAEIEAYYVGRYFNFGDTDAHPADKMVKAVKVEFLD